MYFNKNTTIKDFDYIVNKIHQQYNFIQKENIMAIYVKELPNADLLLSNKDGSAGKTTHIACTSDSRLFFKDFIANAILNNDSETFYDDSHNDYKFKIFIEDKYVNKKNNFIESHCALWVIHKKNDENQLGLSKDKYDDDTFKQLRKCMFKENILIFFKYFDTNKKSLDYYLILLNNKNDCLSLQSGIGKLKNKIRYAEKCNF